MMCKMLTGRSVRPTTLAFVPFRRAAVFMMALAISLHVAMAAPRPSAPPVEPLVLTMPDCAGPHATVSITMDPDYMGDFGGCTFNAAVASNGCTATVYIPGSTCVPESGTMTMATVFVRNQYGQVHAVFAVKAVDGIVNVDIVEI